MELQTIESSEMPSNSPAIYEIGKRRMRAIYWRPIKNRVGEVVDWVQTKPLPADPMSIQQYLRKGFRAKPPTAEKVVIDDGKIPCPLCDFRAESAFGLASHLRSHGKSSKEE